MVISSWIRCDETIFPNTIWRKTCGLTPSWRISREYKSRAWNAAATSASSRENSAASVCAFGGFFCIGRWMLDVGRLLCDSTRQAFHSRPGRSFSKNNGRIFASDDRASRRTVQKSLSGNSSPPPGTFRHEATRFSFYLIGLGRDGSRHPQYRKEARALLHVRRLFR